MYSVELQIKTIRFILIGAFIFQPFLFPCHSFVCTLLCGNSTYVLCWLYRFRCTQRRFMTFAQHSNSNNSKTIAVHVYVCRDACMHVRCAMCEYVYVAVHAMRKEKQL